MAFERLHPRITKLLEEQGFVEETPLQAQAMPPILDGKHCLVLAPTGMGKTEAAVLPILHELLAMPQGQRKGFCALYITPLRALNRDILRRLVEWCRELDITIGVRHGDTSKTERARQAKAPPQFLITTPETLQALFTGAKLRQALRNVRFVVVDEVHELVGDERGAQLTCGLERLSRIAGDFQRVGLSATVGDPRAAADFLGGRDREVEVVHVPIGKQLDVAVEHPARVPADDQLAAKLLCSPKEAAMVRRVAEHVEAHTSTLVFVNTRRMAEVLAARLGFWGRSDIAVHHGSLHKDERVRVGADPEVRDDSTRSSRVGVEIKPGIWVGLHHGSLHRDERVRAEEEFKAGRLKGLICTSSMELGIDIGSADFVVQITSPHEVGRLLQRIGRAGHRMGLVSRGAVLVTDADDVAEALVIRERALAERVEAPIIPECPLDVLANQLEAMTLESDVLLSEALDILRRARPFWNLEDAQVDEVLQLLDQTKLLTLFEGTLARRKRARIHFVENLSMIPDQATFLVRDVATRRPIGSLDESFVATYIEPGALFIFKGHPWRVLEFKREGLPEPEVLVAPIHDPTGAVPSWVGEEIPVPHEVAQDVGRLRERLRRLIDDRQDPVAWLRTSYGIDAATAQLLADGVRTQGELTVPTQDVVTLETGPGVAVLNCCLGRKANEALGTALSGLLAARLGSSVGLDVDPYRVMLELPRRTPIDLVAHTLREIQGVPLEALLRPLLANAPLLRFKLVHVARKFGVLDKGATSANVNIGRMLDRFRDSAMHEEAVREVLRERMDVPRAEAFLADLAAGRVKLVHQALSPIGQAGFEDATSLVSPRRATAAILRAMEERLLDEPIVLACLHCKKWQSETRVRRVNVPVTCPSCSARAVTLVRPWQKERLTVITEKRPDAEAQKEMRRLRASASLIASHGEDALVLLVARGIGPDTAGRLLLRQRDDRETLLRDILEAEITYARTRAFWD